MMRRYGFSWILVILCVLFAASTANAQWVRNGTPVGYADYNQETPTIVPDGVGGAMIAWADYRSGAGGDIYGNRITADGIVLGGSGVPFCSAAGDQYNPRAVLDGMGNVILVWMDNRAGYTEIYAQKIDTAGNVYWPADGINVCPGTSSINGEARAVPDGAGGVFVTWYDYRNGGYDIFAQRVDGNGALVWGDAGMPVCTYSGEQYAPEMASDHAGGAIVVWQDYRASGDVYAQRIDADGNLLWNPDAVPVSAVGSYSYDIRIVTNAGGEPYIAWVDQRYGYDDVFVQYLDLSGAPVWEINGVSVCDDEGYYYFKYSPKIVPDGAGGVIVAWWDYRTGESYDVFAQRIAWDGARAWDQLGKMLIPALSAEGPFSMISDGAGGAIVGADLYPGEYMLLDIYAQKVDSDGNLLWGSRGAPVSVADSYQYHTMLVPDGFGGAIFAYEDYRPAGEYPDIYCQHLNAAGLWGNPEPEILSCVDVPADQGGWVRITTRASTLDAAGEANAIFGYNVWRLIGSGGGPTLTSAAPTDRSKVFALLSDPLTAKGVRVSGSQAAALGLPEGDWESVGFWFATRDTVYNIAVPTKNDSTEAGTAEETYIVTAHTSTAGVFITSEPAAGYSVDNLAPGVTPGLVGNEIAAPAGLLISWDPNVASDIWKYNVYRGDSDLFVPDESSLLGSTTDTELHDGTWVWAYQYFYKLVAVDRHGNMGPEALLRPEDINVGTLLASFAASLSGSVVKVEWTLSEADEDVKFAVLRSTGGSFEDLASPAIARDGLSFSLTDGSVEPGTTYTYRVSVVGVSGTRVLFETDAISTPAMPLALHQNHPNPFNPSTTIGYYLPAAAVVTLDVYDSTGRLVSRLVDRAAQDKGTHSVEWRGSDARGNAASSGVYFYRLTSGKETISKKMILLR